MAGAVRQPAVAGRFYPSDPDILRADVQSYLTATNQPAPAIGCLAPHAGYVYSGGVAGAVFASLEIPRHCVVLCPNHTGRGAPLAIMSQGFWRTPLGDVPIDSGMAAKIKQRFPAVSFPAISEDAEAHRAEHAIEVELPFLQMSRMDVTFVPIALGTSQFESLNLLGEALADVIADADYRILIIASGDMNHYQSDEVTRVKDGKAIDRILALDARGLFEVVKREKISMCGLGPVVTMLTAAKRLGATAAELVKYATSADVSGDPASVVGYAGIIVR